MLKRKKYFTSLKNEIAFNNYKIWDVLKNTKECMLHFATLDCIEINWTFWDKLRVTMERVRENLLCVRVCVDKWPKWFFIWRNVSFFKIQKFLRFFNHEILNLYDKYLYKSHWFKGQRFNSSTIKVTSFRNFRCTRNIFT